MRKIQIRVLAFFLVFCNSSYLFAVSGKEYGEFLTQSEIPEPSKPRTNSRTLHQRNRDRCPDGSPPGAYQCGCEIVTSTAVNAVRKVSRNNAVQCTPICNTESKTVECEDTVRENCASHVCVKDSCGVTGLSSSDIRNIQRGCDWDEDKGWYVCQGGFTVSRTTYNGVSGSDCVPVCGQPQLSCQSPAMFGPPIFKSSPNTTDDEIRQEPINCEDGQDPDGYLCSCQVASNSEMDALREVMEGQDVPCVPYCGDQDAALSSCKRSRCNRNLCIGPREGIMCGTFVQEQLTNAIFNFNCENTRQRDTVMCTSSSGSYVELDEPSYKTITSGFCFPGCGIPFSDLRCRFNANFKNTFLNETEEDAILPESTPTPESVPASESAEAPASESEISPELSVPMSEPADAPESVDAPYSEPDYSESAPVYDSEIAPYSEPDYIYSEVAPALESEIAPYSEFAIESFEAMSSAYASAPDFDICEIFRRRTGFSSINDGVISEDDFDGYFDIPSFCLDGGPSPSSEEAPESYSLDLEDSIEAPESSISQIPISIEVETRVVEEGNHIYEGPWRECSQYCAQAGSATEDRSVTCRNRFGIPILLEQCDEDEIQNTTSTRPCTIVDRCAGPYYYELGEWTACSRSCIAFNEQTSQLEFGEQTRTATCIHTDGSIINEEVCMASIPQDVSLSRRCNAFPCEMVSYVAGDWGRCSCDRSMQTRSLTCRNATGMRINAQFCDAYNVTRPRTERSCIPMDCELLNRKLLQQQNTSDFDLCSNVPCSREGSCVDGVCTCNDGYGGVDCQQDLFERSGCPSPGQLGPTGVCCPSGIFETTNYTCCEGEIGTVHLDRDGACCDQALDLCGICGGMSVVDVTGRCCGDDFTLDPNGYCCRFMDECGVCQGTGDSCQMIMDFEVQVPRDQVEEDCAPHITALVDEIFGIESIELENIEQIGTTSNSSFTVVLNDSSLSTAEAERRLIVMHFDIRGAEDSCPLIALEASRRPICGNRFCEIGEPIIRTNGEEANDNQENNNTTPCSDCDFAFEFCPLSRGYRNISVPCSGHGRCLFAETAVCDCYTGYTGDNCDECSMEYYRIDEPNFLCLPRQGLVLSRINQTEHRQIETPESEIDTRNETATPPIDETEATEVSTGLDGAGLIPSSPNLTSQNPTEATDSDGVDNVDFIRGTTFSSDDDGVPLPAILVPVSVFVLCCLILAAFLARRRNRSSTDNYAQKRAFKLEEVEKKPGATGTPSRSYNQVWHVFRQNLATGILHSRKHGTSDSASGSKSRKDVMMSGSALDPDRSTDAETRNVHTNGTRTSGRTRVSDVRATPSTSAEAAAMQTTLLMEEDDGDTITQRRTPTNRRHGLMDVARWNSRQMSIDRGTDEVLEPTQGGGGGGGVSLRYQDRDLEAVQGPSTSLLRPERNQNNMRRIGGGGGGGTHRSSSTVQRSRSDDENDAESVETGQQNSDGGRLSENTAD
eukprot:g8014.t1